MIIPTHPPPWQIMATSPSLLVHKEFTIMKKRSKQTDDSQRVENVTNIDPKKNIKHMVGWFESSADGRRLWHRDALG